MEEHRLKPMKVGYDEKLFNELYQQTQKLREKLARGINPGYYGVEYQEVLSWFDVKFIFTFNKYQGENEKYLKGNIIKALSMYKSRILRNLYSEKRQIHNYQNIVDIEAAYNLKNYQIDFEQTPREVYKELLMSFMEDNLSREAYRLLNIQIDPPLYITSRAAPPYIKIPNKLITEYLNIPLKKLKELIIEVESTTLEAQLYFNN